MAARKASGTLQSPNSVLGHALDIEHSLGRLSVGSQGASEWATETHFASPAGLNPSAGCWQPPAPLLIYPHSPVSPYRVPAGVPAYAGWQWQSQLPSPSAQPTRSVVAIARAGTCLSESRLRHVVGGHGSVRAITPIDQHGTCSVVSFYDVRSAVAFFDAITKDPAVEQAFFIMPPLNGPGMDNQGVLVVSLGAATAAEQEPLPDPQQQADVREAAEAFGAVEDVCQEAGDNGAGRHWRVCFADTRDAETAKHGLEGLEVAGRPAHIEFWAPPGAAYLPVPMVAPPAPPPPPPAGWSSAPMAAPSSPSAYMGMFPAPSPSYGSYSPGSAQAGSGEYVALGFQPVALSRSNSADYGMGIGGGVMAAFSWAPYGGSYPMYPGAHRPLELETCMNMMSSISPGSPTNNGSMRSASTESPYSSGGGPVFREAASRLSPGRSPRAWSRTNRSSRAEFDAAAYAFDPVEGRKPGARTTLMIRNIPNKYTQAMLLDILEDLCSGKYDFFYLPIDYKNKCNLGYAFVNFTEPEAAAVFFMERHQQRWQEFNSKKVCEVTYARVQGQQALVDHFRNSKFPCADADSLPLIFRPSSPTSQGKEKAAKWSTATKLVAVPITQLITSSSSSVRTDVTPAAADG